MPIGCRVPPGPLETPDSRTSRAAPKRTEYLAHYAEIAVMSEYEHCVSPLCPTSRSLAQLSSIQAAIR